MKTIYEAHDFYSEFYLFGILGLIFTLFGLFGWRIIITDKEFRQKGLFLRLMFLFFGIISLYITFPYVKDIPYVQQKQYEITTGKLTDVWITESSDARDASHSNSNDGSSHTTEFTIDNTYFILMGRYTKLTQLIDVDLQVSYLPHSRKVIKIDIPLTKENLN